jgi:ankyrin repeat protein
MMEMERWLASLICDTMNDVLYVSISIHPGSTEVCYFLLNEGADRDKKDNNKRKPLHIAEHLKHGEVVSLLEKHKRILL